MISNYLNNLFKRKPYIKGIKVKYIKFSKLKFDEYLLFKILHLIELAKS